MKIHTINFILILKDILNIPIRSKFELLLQLFKNCYNFIVFVLYFIKNCRNF